ncbi:hypothetical protein [Methylobacterium sp. J-090]|uniref:hypothetical protein n=1 Tax=Methylobacterium sp. J-090 TaxID=2836666 RepID=UPI001FB94216|nr:hypothetical protein [Methylobacterium sp. J-090]MCJ2084334.1 hypothetical protein [Methylobacterium sp. J-090]
MTSDVDAARRALGDPTAIVFSLQAEKALARVGLPLADLLAEAVTGVPAVRVLMEHVSGHRFHDWSSMVENRGYFCDARSMLDGRFLEHQPAWPAVLRRYDLLVEWCDLAGSRFAEIEPTERAGRLDRLADDNPDAYHLLGEIRGIARTVRERYEAMMALLRGGDLEASGHARGSGAPAPILPGVWSAPKTRVSFVDGEILEVVHVGVERTGNWPPSRVERTEVRWSGVVVRRVGVSKDAASVAARPERSKGGAPPKFPWESAFDRLMLRVSTDGKPETGAELARWLADALEQEGAVGVDLEYVKQHLRNKHPILWQACLQST